MKENDNDLTKEIELWSFLGPFMLVVILIVLLLNPLRSDISIPLVALFGLLLCWKDGQRGLVVSLIGLAGALTYQLWTSPLERVFWDLMLAAATALTFTVTALSFKEIRDILRLKELSPILAENTHIVNVKIATLEAQLEAQTKTIVQIHDQANQAQLKADQVQLQLSQTQQRYDSLLEENQKLQRIQQEAIEKLAIKEKEHQTIEKELATLRMANKQKELHISQQVSSIQDLQKQIVFLNAELEQSQSAAKEFILASDKKEQSLESQLNLLENKIKEYEKTLSEVHEQGHQEIVEEEIAEPLVPSVNENSVREKKERNKSSTKAKAKNNKPTKTNHWANAILSRWSESHDQSQ